MGAFSSVPECQAHFNITVDCHYTETNETGRRYSTIGGYERGQFPADPDVAGIGILSVFIAVTSFAIAVSFASVLWKVAKVWKSRTPPIDGEKTKTENNRSLLEILETIVISCSDQQVFTGGAYALTLRYWKGCTISAYHYNLVANMMLLTCATHLMSVTIVRNYWRYPWLAVLRVICISGLFIVTGLLFTNQNARKELPFPTELPMANETDSLIFLPAACFQTAINPATETFQATTANSTAFFDTLRWSRPGNLIQGWNWYVLILLFYGAAILAEFVRFCRRGKSRPGWRSRLAAHLRTCFGRGTIPRFCVQYVFFFYLIAGVGISIVTTVFAAKYIFSLRNWADHSGWIESDNGTNAENDFSSFGQLVPIWTSAMIVFSFFGIISERITHHGNRKHAAEERPPQIGTIPYLDPSNYDLYSPETGKLGSTTSYFSPMVGGGGGGGGSGVSGGVGTASATRPASFDLEAQSGAKPHGANRLGYSPLLGGSSMTGLAITAQAASPKSPRASSSTSLAGTPRPSHNNDNNNNNNNNYNGGYLSNASPSSRPRVSSSSSPAPEGRRPQQPGTPPPHQQSPGLQGPKPPNKKSSP